MMYGFTYRGRHTKEFGLVVKTKNRPASPPMRLEEVSAPYRDGAVDYSNISGRIRYNDRLVTVELTAVDNELSRTHGKIAEIVSWLSGWYDSLIFDDMPYTVWNARPVDFGNIENQLYRIGKFTVQFRCTPFNTDIIPLKIFVGEDIPVGTDMEIGYRNNETINFGIGETKYDFYYDGDAPMRPKFIISENIQGISIQLNGCTLEYESSFGQLELDCDTWAAKADGEAVTQRVRGDYPELFPGNNSFVITAGCTGSLEIEGNPKYIYGVGGVRK